jgi:hypothetical protein
MCAELWIMDGDRFVEAIETTAQAVARFGAEHVRLSNPHNGSDDPRSLPTGDNLDWCLCPIDIDRLLEAHGYRRIGMDDPRWSPLDILIERQPPN